MGAVHHIARGDRKERGACAGRAFLALYIEQESFLALLGGDRQRAADGKAKAAKAIGCAIGHIHKEIGHERIIADFAGPKESLGLALRWWRPALIVLVIILVSPLTLAISETARDCDTVAGRLKAYIESMIFPACACHNYSLDFSYPCNSLYIPRQ